MGRYLNFRQVLLHTACVITLSVAALRWVFDEQSCRLESWLSWSSPGHLQKSDPEPTLHILRQPPTIEVTSAATDERYPNGYLAESVSSTDDSSHDHFCPQIPGMEDIFYIIKTGSTEALERLPVHIRTTMRCWPHTLVFSDYGEVIENVTLHDALDEVEDWLREDHSDFELRRQLYKSGRGILDTSNFTSDEDDNTSVLGMPGNAGWRLDRFKSLPMVPKAYNHYPTAKWYIFTDADTWVSPTNLVNWLGRFDHSKQWYLGNPSVIGQQGFGHGGSGYILSNSAMNAASKMYARESQYWDRFAAKHWAGDCVLATALQHRLHIPVSWSYPLLQSESPFMLDYTEQNYYRKLWCYPVVSYHHASPSTIDTLWEFEKNWTAQHHTSVQPMKHKDVFKEVVMPKFSKHDQQEWDNLSGDVVPFWTSDQPPNFNAEALRCRQTCEQNSTCLQFSYSNHECRTSGRPKVGKTAGRGVRSGWLPARIQKYMTEYDDCNDGRWIVHEAL